MRRSRPLLVLFSILVLLLTACDSTPVGPTPTLDPAHITLSATTPPTTRPAATATTAPSPTKNLPTITPQPTENMSGEEPPAIPPTLNPTALAALPRANGLPLLPFFETNPAITLPRPSPRANYGAGDKPRVGLQVGHWQAENHPAELAEFRQNSGAASGGMREVDLNLDIARRTAELLKGQGVEVDILPATPPVNYTADLFLALHADGDTTGRWRGFKLARSRYSLLPHTDDELVKTLYRDYAAATDLPRDDSHISTNMLGYFAFNNRRYQHAINPLTPAAILEMGYVSNTTDRDFFRQHADTVAQGIANGVLDFLGNRPALELREQPATWQILQANNDKTPVYSRQANSQQYQPLAYLSKGQQFNWFFCRDRDGYCLVDVPALRQGLFVKKSDFTVLTNSLKP